MIPLQKLLNALSADVLEALAADGQAGPPAPDVMAAALAAAEEEVRHALSSAGHGGDLPPHFADLAVTLAIEALFHRRREMLPAEWAERAARGRRILAEVVAGRHPVVPPLHRVTGTTTPPPHANAPLKRL